MSKPNAPEREFVPLYRGPFWFSAYQCVFASVNSFTLLEQEHPQESVSVAVSADIAILFVGLFVFDSTAFLLLISFLNHSSFSQ